jgi:splicing factor 3B subunit 1
MPVVTASTLPYTMILLAACAQSILLACASAFLQAPKLGGSKVIDREDDYKRRRLNQRLSPDRADAFQLGEQTPAGHLQTYAEIMKQKQLEREQANTLENIAKAKEAAAAAAQAAGAAAAPAAAGAAVGQKRRNRWDQSGDEQ